MLIAHQHCLQGEPYLLNIKGSGRGVGGFFSHRRVHLGLINDQGFFRQETERRYPEAVTHPQEQVELWYASFP
jgi:hypothetical protein